ncbi:MAG: rhomboid family intramembrane serine protease [Isosphaeraceae bacterium]
MILPLGDVDKTRIVPVVTYALITLNVLTFAVQSMRGEDFNAAYAIVPYEITHRVDLTEPVFLELQGTEDPRVPAFRRVFEVPQAPGPVPIWLTLLTSMFMHGSFLHLAGNMLFLWIFGDNVEEVLGRVRYVLVYLTCGLIGSLFQIAAAPNSVIPCLGASGAIAGVMGMYVIWFPHNRIVVLVFRFITELPALVVIGLWIALQVWAGVGSFGRVGESGGVAYLAHVGGAVAGIAAAFLFLNRARYDRMRREAERGWTDRRPGAR